MSELKGAKMEGTHGSPRVKEGGIGISHFHCLSQCEVRNVFIDKAPSSI